MWYRRLYFPSEGRHAEDFFVLKNPDSFGRVGTHELGYLKARDCNLECVFVTILRASV